MFKIIYTNVKPSAETILFNKSSSPSNENLISSVKNALLEQHALGKIISYTSYVSQDSLTVTAEFTWESEQDYLNFIANNAQILSDYSNARNAYNAINNIVLTKTAQTV